jgi:hypothetical protein
MSRAKVGKVIMNHDKDRSISGLPKSLPQAALAVLVEDGSVVALALGELLQTFRIASGPEHCAAHEHAS